MISKSLFFKLMMQDLRKRVWFPILVFVSYFLMLEVELLMAIEGLQREPELFVAKLEVFFTTSFLGNTAMVMAVAVCITAVLSAISGFSYLHSKVQLDTYHSLPVSRTQLFWSKYLSGILQFFIPFLIHVLICVGIVAKEGAFGAGTAAAVASYIWMMLVIFVLTYSVSIVAAGLTGNIIVSVLGTGVLFGYSAVVSVLVHVLFNKFYDTFYLLEGGEAIVANGKIWCFSPLSMIIKLFSAPEVITEAYINRVSNYDAPYLWVMLAAAAVYSLAAYAICVKRKSEAAGKSIAFGAAEPVIKTLIVIPVSLFAGLFFDTISYGSGSDGWFLFGMIFMFVICCALMEIIFRLDMRGALMHKRQFIFNAACTALIFVVLRYDVAGYNTYVPSDAQLKSCAVSIDLLQFSQTVPAKNGRFYHMNAEQYRMANMELQGNPSVMELARKAASEKLSSVYAEADMSSYEAEMESKEGYRRIVFGYKLLNGKTIYRQYIIDIADADTFRLLSDIFKDYAYKTGSTPIFDERFPVAYDSLECTGNFSAETIRLTPDMQSKLIAQYKEEYTQLTLGTVMDTPPVGVMQFVVEYKTNAKGVSVSGGVIGYSGGMTSFSGNLPVYPQFTKTIALLKEFGFDMEEKPAAEDVKSVKVEKRKANTRTDLAGVYTEAAVETVTDEYTDKGQIQQILDSVINTECVNSVYGYAQFYEYNYEYSIDIQYYDETDKGYSNHCFIKGKVPEFVKQ